MESHQLRSLPPEESYWGHGRQVALLLGPPEKDWSDAVSEPGFLEAQTLSLFCWAVVFSKSL